MILDGESQVAEVMSPSFGVPNSRFRLVPNSRVPFRMVHALARSLTRRAEF